MEKKIAIAIDGPVGSGKSTIAKLVARELGYTYIDTGAMYRGIALKAKRMRISWEDAQRMASLAGSTEIVLLPATKEELTSRVLLDGEEVSCEIRETDIGEGASKSSTISGVRKALVKLQKGMAVSGGVVMEGRDIGTVVLPGAELKIFLTGSIEERAKRRFLELQKKGKKPEMREVIEEVRERDLRDSTRADSPLKKAEDAVEVDTTHMTIAQVVDTIVEMARELVRSKIQKQT
ncbi:MAG: (d)CMP kinase [Candidatus Aureabacteria bacterium]|nr:(d)CMP kinase [Candidatus Auribacterota bacterium]